MRIISIANDFTQTNALISERTSQTISCCLLYGHHWLTRKDFFQVLHDATCNWDSRQSLARKTNAGPWHGYNRGVKVPTSDTEQEPKPKQRNGKQRRSIVTNTFLVPRASAPSGRHHAAMKLQAQGVSVQTDALYST